MAISAFSGLTGWYLHRPVLDIASTFMSLSSTSNNFETSFFSLLSFVYGLFSGQTFLFLYERQVDILQELYSEIFALENLIQLTFVSCPDVELRSRMADSLQRYVRSEVYDPSDMTSPFDEKGPYMEILDTISLASDQSVVVTDLVEAAKHLADAQSRRSAVASQILPDVHYLFMLVQVMAIIISFLVFDYTEINGGGEEERRLLFGALISFLTLTSIVLWDLSDPLHGLYSFRGNLDKRIGLLAKAFKALKSQDAAFIPKPVETLRKLGIVSFPSAGGSSKVTKKQRLPF